MTASPKVQGLATRGASTMSRVSGHCSRRKAPFVSHFSRRSFLKGSSGTIGAAALASFATDTQLAYAASRSVSAAGTTLAQAAMPTKSSGYARLTAGPGYALTVREDLATGKSGRDGKRRALASIVQFTDLHIIDAQSPLRFEFLSTVNGSAARPQEALGTHGAAQLVRRVNMLKKGPFTGRPFDCLVSTGDNTDNHETIELEWFLTVMSGGTISQNTGAADRWEGVQTAGDTQYYNVQDEQVHDRYKAAGFPTIPGFFGRAVKPHTSPGLDIPWYAVFGNHDDSISGVLPSDWGALAAAYTGNKKFMGFASGAANQALKAAKSSHSTEIRSQSSAFSSTWTVTPDARRRPFTPTEFMKAHLASSVDGAGPHGHGFTEENIATGHGYYSFRIAEGVTGIAMDSTNRAGFTEGSLGDEQFRWLQRRLEAGSSRYWDSWGIEQHKTVDDELFVLFSHHTSATMSNLLMDPAKAEIRHSGLEVQATLQRYPNVIAWVNGHTHVNKIMAHRHADPRRSYWEINTASHVDFPQHARLIEVVDNSDGTLSLLTTLIESAAPYAAATNEGSQAALASLYREFSFNDFNAKKSALGEAGDRNAELLLANPLY